MPPEDNEDGYRPRGEVVDTLLGLQRRLRGEPAPRGILRSVDEDEVIVLEDAAPAPVTGGDRAEMLDARLDRLEEDLAGVFESVGRLAADLDRVKTELRAALEEG